MRKILKFCGFCCLLAVLIWFGGILADRKNLGEDIIRLHVVANSDSQEDQHLKLQVRDAVVEELQAVMEEIPSAEEAKLWIQDNIGELERFVNQFLANIGSADTAKVTFMKEEFDTREYDTFSLPAGVYESLRISIGDGQGKNWWCVVFPTLCAPATTKGFADTAAGSGFDDGLTGALQHNGQHEVRFFLLDCLGRIQNFFH